MMTPPLNNNNNMNYSYKLFINYLLLTGGFSLTKTTQIYSDYIRAHIHGLVLGKDEKK